MQGCGKTVEILALILSNQAAATMVSGSVASDGITFSRWGAHGKCMLSCSLFTCDAHLGHWTEAVHHYIPVMGH